MRKLKTRKGYTLYLELDNKTEINIAHTYSANVADIVYSQYISQVRRGLDYYKTHDYKGRITQVILEREWDGARFSFSKKDGFKEIFKRSA